MIGNGLRELDRFLSLLIDEVAAVIAPTGLDRAKFARQHNTANKLRTVRAAMALPSPDHQALLAIGRRRDGLFYCAEIVRRGDKPPVDPGSRQSRRIAHVGTFTPAAPELGGICRLYTRVAAELLHAMAKFGRSD